MTDVRAIVQEGKLIYALLVRVRRQKIVSSDNNFAKNSDLGGSPPKKILKFSHSDWHLDQGQSFPFILDLHVGIGQTHNI